MSESYASKEYLSPSQAAVLWNVSQAFIYNEIQQHRLPAVKLGRIYRIPREELTRYTQDRMFNSAQ